METEEKARAQGWTDKDSFKGDPDRWVTAEAYVERADKIMPIMKATMGKYEKTIESQTSELKTNKADIAELRETMRKLATVNQNVSETAYNRAMETIRAEQTKAINDGDGDAFARLEKDKDDLIRKKPEVVDVQSPTPDNAEENPEYQTWMEETQLYNDNAKLKE